MGFHYAEARDTVVVHGLIAGDDIDGLEYPRPDFVALVNDVLEEVAVYESEEEEAAALRNYLAALPPAERESLQRQLPTFAVPDGEMSVSNLNFLYDDEQDSVVVNVKGDEGRYHYVDQLGMSMGVFLGVVGEVLG